MSVISILTDVDAVHVKVEVTKRCRFRLIPTAKYLSEDRGCCSERPTSPAHKRDNAERTTIILREATYLVFAVSDTSRNSSEDVTPANCRSQI